MLHSPLTLPGSFAPTGSETVDVHVEITRSSDVGPDGWTYRPPEAEYGYGSARLTIRPAALHCALKPDTPERIAELLVLGPGLAGVLSARAPVLHGTTVRLPGEDADTVVLGPSGAGKSTLSAAMLQQGARLVADDLAVLDRRDDALSVRIGPPQIKLWADAASALGIQLEGQPRVHPDHDKHRVTVGSVGSETPGRCPVGRLVYVQRGPELSLTPVPPAEARTILLANHRLPEILMPADQPRWLAAVHQLARDVPMVRVVLPGPHEVLRDAVAAIARHTR